MRNEHWIRNDMVYMLIQERLWELHNSREVHLKHKQQVGVYPLGTLVLSFFFNLVLMRLELASC